MCDCTETTINKEVLFLVCVLWWFCVPFQLTSVCICIWHKINRRTVHRICCVHHSSCIVVQRDRIVCTSIKQKKGTQVLRKFSLFCAIFNTHIYTNICNDWNSRGVFHALSFTSGFYSVFSREQQFINNLHRFFR